MRLFFFLLFFIPSQTLAASSAASLYEKMLGTISTSTEPTFANGNLEGCSVVYSVLMRDGSDKIGRFLKVFGNFSLMSMKGQIGLTLKVVVNELSLENGSASPLTPSDAYFVWPDFTTSKNAFVNGTPSDTPGSYFAIYQPTQIEKLLAAMEKSKVTVAYRLKEDAIDQKFSVNLDVLDTNANGQRVHDQRAINDFYQCASKLIEPSAKGR